ncbi:MAG: alpha/beta fold hydrolase [Pseudomonadota bacterium]|nr:alpha/beta fold hydrolase [Pseudomonadota bacterium]
MLGWKMLGALMLMAMASVSQGAFWHKPPGAPEQGFGSREHDITDTYFEYQFGSAADGNQTWYYVPAQLKYDTTAPVVVFLHGFAALIPKLYQTHIEHLLKQGNIVIFPQFQKATLTGFLSEAGLFAPADQSLWAARAVATVNQALDELGEQVQADEVYLYGHSLGGLIALAWQSEGGVAPRAAVLVHPQVNSQEGIPAFVRAFLNIIEIPWRDYAPYIDFPVVILNGDEDTIATVEQSREILSLLSAVPSAELYIAQRDCFGYPCVSPNHGGPLDKIQGLPAHLKLFSVSGELDSLDWRYYFAGLDAVMAGWRQQLPFDPGHWSNGRPIKPVLVEALSSE